MLTDIHFLARSEKTNQKRGATPKAGTRLGIFLSAAQRETRRYLWGEVGNQLLLFFCIRFFAQPAGASARRK